MEAKLCFIGQGLMENHSGLIVDTRLTRVSGHAERLAALDTVGYVANRLCAITLAVDRGDDAADFVEELRGMNVRPQVAQNISGRRSAIDRRTRRHLGYAKSQRMRKRIEEAFGWIKTIAGLRKTKLRGLANVARNRAAIYRSQRLISGRGWSANLVKRGAQRRHLVGLSGRPRRC